MKPYVPLASDRTEAVAAPGRLVATRLGRLFATLHGRGDNLLVLWPSIFTDQAIYAGLVARLGATHRLLLIDGAGHGQSEGPTRPFPVEDAAHAMAEVMDAFGIEQAIVGGTSWGGLVGAAFARLHPARTQAVILMNTPMTIGASAPHLSKRLIAFGARLIPGWGIFANGVAKSFFSADALAANPAYAAHFPAMLRAADRRQLGAAVASVLLHGAPLLEQISAITAPVLIVAGTRDAMYPLETQAQAALRAPDAMFQPVPGKHISVIDCPDAVAAAITDFMTAKVHP